MIRQWLDHAFLNSLSAPLILEIGPRAARAIQTPPNHVRDLHSALPEYFWRLLPHSRNVCLVVGLIVDDVVHMTETAGFNLMAEDQFKDHHPNGEESGAGIFLVDGGGRNGGGTGGQG